MRDAWLLALCASRALGTLIFMTYAATLPLLRQQWGMSAAAAGSILTAFQLGYAVSLIVCSALADRVGARRVFLTSAWLGAVAAMSFAAFAESYRSALVLYALVALTSGGTYNPGIMMLADRYPGERRGRAVGWLIASTSLGYAGSLLVAGVALAAAGIRGAFLATACGPVLGAVLATVSLRGTRDVVHRPGAGLRFTSEVLRNGAAMRLIAGYAFHNWELWGMFAWAPAFMGAVVAASGTEPFLAAQTGAQISAAFHLIGLLASLSMGHLADRLGSRTLLMVLASTSTLCSLAFGWLIHWPLAIVVIVGLLYGFTAVGDSPVLSSALTQVVTPSYLGTALALRALMGWSASSVAPLVFGAVLDATNGYGAAPAVWGWAFSSLAIAGCGAIVCAAGLTASPQRARS